MDTSEKLDRFFAENPVAETTETLYRYALTGFLDTVSPEIATTSDIHRYLKGKGWGNSLQYTASIAIKKYIRWSQGENHPALKLRVKREKPKQGRVLKPALVEKLLLSFDTSTKKGKRDLAIACLALDTGLRVAELARLEIHAIDLEARTLTVKVKGGTYQEAVFSEYTAAAIGSWAALRAAQDPRLFQVTRDGLRVIIRRWGEKLGIKLSPHDLRRTFAVIATRAGAPSRVLQAAGRWSSITMIQRYTQSITPQDFEAYFPIKRIFQLGD